MTKGLALGMVKVALTLMAIAVLVYKIDLAEVAAAFKHMHWAWLAAALLALILEFWVSSYKTQWMSGAGSVVDHMRFNAVKSLVNQVLPGGVGGEAARMLYLAELKGSKARATGVLIADRWSGLCTQIFWSGLSLVVLTAQIKPTGIGAEYWGLAGWAAMVLALMGWLWGPRCMAWTVELLPQLLLSFLPRLMQRWSPRLNNWGTLQAIQLDTQGFKEELLLWSHLNASNFRLFLFATGNQITMVAMLLFSGLALGHALNPWLASPIFLLSSLSTLIPSALGNLGVQEAFFAYGYHLAGQSAGQGLSVALLLRVLGWVPSLFGIYWLFRGRSQKVF